MKKLWLAGLLVLLVLGIGAVAAKQGFLIKVFKVPTPDHKPAPAKDMEQLKGKHGETIVKHPQGTDIIPPKRSGKEFSDYKKYRLEVLQNLTQQNPEKTIRAHITLDKAVTPAEFDELMAQYTVDIIGVEGYRDGTFLAMRYSYYTTAKEELKSITSAVIESTGQELLKIQENNKVLLVDANIEGIHSRVLP
jgi:hypothetical protein